MFEQLFAWSMRNGSRILFAAACVMLFSGFLSFVLLTVTSVGYNNGITSLALTLVVSHLAPAAYLFFGALLIEYLGRGRSAGPPR
jgi:hypothetical protein